MCTNLKFKECELESVAKWTEQWRVWASEWKIREERTIKVAWTKSVFDLYLIVLFGMEMEAEIRG